MGEKNKRILLIIGGGIAAYKCLSLIRLLVAENIDVRVILTKSATQFVTPLSVATLSQNKVYQDLFDLTDELEIGHIQLARDTDLVIVAPATANIIAKSASGIADDLASTALIATDKPILMAPAMNTRMWENAATQRNVETLRNDGVNLIGPNDGFLAEGEYGKGRMAEPEQICAEILSFFGKNNKLKGKKILVTSGPTREPIDPVRYITNRSSGKQGHAIAEALARHGASVTLVSGPVSIPDPQGVKTIKIESAREMLETCQKQTPCDAAIFTAAVSDWRVDIESGQKIKKQKDGDVPNLSFIENPDILATISQLKKDRPKLVIGFAAETENVIQNAEAKLARKKCDWIVANDVSASTGVFSGDENTVILVGPWDKTEAWPKMSKVQVAEKLTTLIADHLID